MSPNAPSCPKYAVLRRQLDLVDAGAKFFSDLFDRAPDAHRLMESGNHVGKIVLEIG